MSKSFISCSDSMDPFHGSLSASWKEFETLWEYHEVLDWLFMPASGIERREAAHVLSVSHPTCLQKSLTLSLAFVFMHYLGRIKGT